MIKWVDRLGDFITDNFLTNNGHYHIYHDNEDTWENIRKEIVSIKKSGQELIKENKSSNNH